MPCPCAAKMDNAEKQGCTHILRKSIYIYILFYLVPGITLVETCYKCDSLVGSS